MISEHISAVSYDNIDKTYDSLKFTLVFSSILRAYERRNNKKKHGQIRKSCETALII